MEIINQKCSFKDHEEINANFYCGECKVYMCNKCENFHSKLLQKHEIFNIEKSKGIIFTGICREENHQMKLEYFCKTHNQLCCAACIAKIIKDKNGMHKDCEVCIIEDIKDEKKNKIKENIKYLEDLSSTLQKSINSLNKILEKIKINKEEIKTKIQIIFTKIRNELNNREDQLLLEVDNQFEEIFFNDNIIKESEKLPSKIKLSLEKGKIIDEEDYENKLSLFINNCINIENNIQEINFINEKIRKCNENKSTIITCIEEDEKVNELLNYIKKFGNLKKIDKNDFQEIENPWTNEQFHNNLFYYSLKENSTIAEKTKDNSYIHLIKSDYQFKKDKIYKLEFIPNYEKGGDFFIGFADFNQSKYHSWMKDSFNCVALSGEGLFINGVNVNNNLKVKTGKKYEYIIDISNKSFILNINGIKSGEYNFNFEDNIFAHVGFRRIGNSTSIKTYEKEK